MVQPFPGGPTGYPGFPPGNTYPPAGGRGGGVPSYPGPASIQTAFPYGPSFDGRYSHGLTNNPYTNSLFEDVNALQHQIYTGGGIGYPTVPPIGLPPNAPPPGNTQP